MLALEEKSSKKRHCGDDKYHSFTDGKTSCSVEKYDQQMQSKSHADVVNCSKEVYISEMNQDINVTMLLNVGFDFCWFFYLFI